METQRRADLNQYRGYLRVLADMQLNPRLRVKEDISDIVQIALMRAGGAIESYRGSSEPELRAWLKSILNRTLINVAKKYGTHKRDYRRECSIDQRLQESAIRFSAELPAHQSTPSVQLMRLEQAEVIADALAQLREDEYRAVSLKHIHGWPVAEIAEHLDRSPEAVAGLLRRGLKKLRRILQEPV